MRVSLATKFLTAIFGVLALAVLSCIVAIGSVYRFEALQRTLVVDNLASVRGAEELEIAPLEQRGHVSLYILGDSAGMQEVFKAIGRVAGTDATVLIRGESGTGKELVARAVYQHSQRANLPLLVINCAAIPEAMLESELFGHERGAFTGAHSRRIGRFQQADGGTIFWDEIGDIAPSVQAKTLRMLQQKTFERIGGNETIHADVRVLAATNPRRRAALGKYV